MTRSVPRSFSYHWGSGQIVEEACAPNDYYEPAIQLLVPEGGEHDGEEHLRFCFYSASGAFQRSPLVMNEGDLAGLRAALDQAPRIKKLLRQLVGG
jgi:hypothetical protein